MVAGYWLIAAALTTAAGTVGLVAYLYRHRGDPGADWFLASLVCQALWNGTYAVALLVDAPAIRWGLEIVLLGLLIGLSLFFVAFALEYTGRFRIDARSTRVAVVATPVVATAFAATNPIHRLLWTDYAPAPVAGLAAVDYALEPLALAIGSIGVVAPVAGSVLLFDTVLSYGPLYRREAVAVGLSTLPPAAAFVAWLYGLGPVPQLNLAPVAFLPHVVLDGYAFVGGGMFEFHPVTRRAGERAVIDDLGDPVIVVDEQGRIVRLNDAARRLLGVEPGVALADDLRDHVDGLDPTGDDQRVTVRTGEGRRTYAVAVTPLAGADGDLGYSLIWQDVTDDIRREQRLTVLNRVLRHNLRNDLGVVRGAAATAADEVEAGEAGTATDLLDTVIRRTDALLSVGESARAVERTLTGSPSAEPVDLDECLAGLAADARETTPDATVEVDGCGCSVVADRQTLEAVIGALLDNAVRHAGAAPSVTVSATERADTVRVTVADDGPGIPDAELAAVESGTETDLAHGSGLGLWLVRWGADRLGADVEFETADGTRATLAIPRE